MAKKLALVFGGSRGIGSACVEILQNEFEVAFTCVSGTSGHRADIQRPEDVKSVFESVEKRYSRKVDCVVVNAGINVPPGPVDTELFRAGKTEEAKQKSAALSPFNRIGRPREVAEVVAFLASEKASWVQGQIVQPNGGMI